MAPTNGHNPVQGQGPAQAYAPRQGYAPVQVEEDGRSIGELFQELTQEARNLVALEVDLAKTEMSEKAGKMGKDAGILAAGGFVIYAGFLALVFAAIAGLANFLAPWLSALIIGVVVILIGYILVRAGLNGLKRANLTPQQTIQSLQQDKEWVQQQVR